MSESPQTVVDKTDASAKPEEQVTDARKETDDLDSLLAQFEQANPKSAEQPPAPAAAAKPDDVTAISAKLAQYESVIPEINNRLFRQDMDQTIKDVRGDLDPGVFDDETVEAWIDGMARKDTRLQQAWLQRSNNPRQWQQIKSELGKKFVQKFSKLPDKSATDDRNIVAAAVRGASTKASAEPPPNYSRMSNAEYRKKVQDEYGFDPGV